MATEILRGDLVNADAGAIGRLGLHTRQEPAARGCVWSLQLRPMELGRLASPLITTMRSLKAARGPSVVGSEKSQPSFLGAHLSMMRPLGTNTIESRVPGLPESTAPANAGTMESSHGNATA